MSETPCWEHEDGGGPRLLTRTVWINLGLTAFFAAFVAAARAANAGRARREPGAPPRYGYGAAVAGEFIAKLGCLFTLGSLGAFLTTYPLNDELACFVQHEGLVVPVAPTLFAYFLVVMIVGAPVRLWTRGSWAAGLGLGAGDRVLALFAYRGVFTHEAARHAGHVTACQDWRATADGEGVRAWCVENALREGLADRVSVTSYRCVEVHGGGVHFAFDGEEDPGRGFDVLLVNFFLSIPGIQPAAVAMTAAVRKKRDRRARTVLRRCARRLRPGARVVLTDLAWNGAAVRAALEGAGFARVERGRLVWFSAFPSREFTAVYEGEGGEGGGGGLDEDEEPVSARGRLESAACEAAAPERPVSAVVWLLLAALVVAAYGLVGLSLPLAAWADANVPARLPWYNRLTSLLAALPSSLPVAMAGALLEVRLAARDAALSAAGLARLSARLVWDVLVGLTLYNAVFWLPSFATDLALYGYASDSTLSLVNIAVNTLVAVLVAKAAPWLSEKLQAGGDGGGGGGGDDGDGIDADTPYAPLVGPGGDGGDGGGRPP